MSEQVDFQIDNQEIDAFIRESFETNFSILRIETGIAISPEVKQTALTQVLLYWRKLHAIALKITDTEVRLSLPLNKSPKGREFGIEGVVDIVREGDRTILYDIKTHDADFIRLNIELYNEQLNTYAYIWQNLYDQPLDQTAIICTDYPDSLRDAILSSSEERIQSALDQWEPVIPLSFSFEKIVRTIQDFGEVVDQIEDHQFTPPTADELETPYLPGHNERFATRVCRNCDARFSCTSYRKYVRHGKGRFEQEFSQYYQDLEEGEPLDDWRTAGLDQMRNIEDLL